MINVLIQELSTEITSNILRFFRVRIKFIKSQHEIETSCFDGAF